MASNRLRITNYSKTKSRVALEHVRMCSWFVKQIDKTSVIWSRDQI